ncbi:2'-5' RNA ligase family protein [Phenylobacterium sp. 20VBR1]|uniref:2'-5' RNA ligase family protein n=1 Tax=Phenylobacterium glaciei TaxID=2803784 RepID=A0A941D256_9CAUL|nr:2'-5' RNA ligase family protein [Phenylobacterium glaciei]
MSAEPFILTAALDPAAADWFEDLRQTHFPPGRNQVPAHLTLFHALPGDQEAIIGDTLKAACARTPALSMEVRGPWSLGRGVAYRLSSPGLERLRADLVAAFEPWLTRQDRAPFRPHITVQNKADPEVARALLTHLQLDFEPFDVTATGLQVWRYLGGPWAPVAELPFSAPGAGL